MSGAEGIPASGGLRRASSRLLPWLLTAAAAVHLYRSPWSASLLHVTPDAVEYAVCAQRFATLGTYDVAIEGVSYPPHSPPWFSVLVLSPAYFLAPRELGAGIVPVLLFSLTGLLAAFSIGKRLAGDWGGAAALVALAFNGVYGAWSREIMTDVPATALGLWGAALFLRFGEGAHRLRAWLLAGALTAAAAALRSEQLAMLLPFAALALRERRSRLARLAALVAPCAAVLLATAVYNQATFGDFRRSGYQFWTPVPWDYPATMFSLGHLRANLANLSGRWSLPGIVLGVIGSAVLLLRSSGDPARRHGLRFLAYLALAAGPGSLAHLVFFHTDARFHVFALSLFCVAGAAGAILLVPRSVREALWPIPILIASAGLVLMRPPDPLPVRRIAAEALASQTPGDAVIVSAIDPVYLEPIVLRGTSRRVVPVSRDVEFASKAVAWKRIAHPQPPPRGLADHRAPGILAGGARDVCAFTADERPEQLAEWARAGIPVYADRSFQPEKLPAQRFRELGLELLVEDPRSPWLSRLVPRR